MAKEPFIISCFTAENDYADLKLPLHHKKSDLEIASDILFIHNVTVLPQPSDDKELWLAEKKRLCKSLSDIKLRRRKRQSQGDLNFYNSSEYPTLTKHTAPSKAVDPDFELDDNDVATHIGAPMKKLDLNSKCNQKFSILTKQIRELILDLCETEDVPVGPCVAKLGSMLLHDAKTNKKHYNYKQAMIFTKIARGDDIYQGAEFCDDDALYLFTSLEVGRDRYTDFKQFCEKHKVKVPCYNKVKKRKLEYVPLEKLDDCFKQGRSFQFFTAPLSKVVSNRISVSVYGIGRNRKYRYRCRNFFYRNRIFFFFLFFKKFQKISCISAFYGNISF